MRILAVDHGEARCGIAVTDPTGTIVRPLDAIEPPDTATIATLAREHEAELIVVGLPLTLAGDEGEQALAAQAFCDELAAAVTVPVELYDERLTTRMAAETARGGAAAAPDALAAAHLLESYLLARAGRGG